MNTPDTCPCGSGEQYQACCGPYIAGRAFPPTAEALMRSRYTAYTRAEVPYIVATVAEERRHLHRPADVEAFARESEWLRLEIVDLLAGREHERVGVVEFKAWYGDKRGLQCLHERSHFQREDGQWRYLNGTYPSRPWHATIGRNDPCPCGSGKKFKKCHGD